MSLPCVSTPEAPRMAPAKLAAQWRRRCSANPRLLVLARPVLTDEPDQLAGADVQRCAAQDINGAPLPSRAVAKGLRHVCDVQDQLTIHRRLSRALNCRSVLIAGPRQMQPLERDGVERDDDARA